VRTWLPAAVVGAGVAAGVAASLGRSDERREYWRAAVEAWRDAPLLGTGAGTWERSWLELREVAFPARDAHSLYLEALSELGPPALVLLAALLVPPLVAAGRARSSPGAGAGTAAFAAVTVHLAVDWDWELPAVVLAGLLPGAALLVAAREDRPVVVPRAAVLAPAAVLAAATVPLLAGNVAVTQAQESLRAGDAAGAAARARRAGRLQPWAAEPRRLLAEAELARGERAAAEQAVAAAIERDDGDVEVWRTAAHVREGTGRRRAEARTRELDPRGSAAGGGAAASS
jgi:O-antigen ligase